MTEFGTEYRHYCRNPKCRSKLKTPVENPREAFCTRGCHSSFYRKRCLVCEGPMERKTEKRQICNKAKCRNAFRDKSCLGRYVTSRRAKSSAKNVDFIDLKQALGTRLAKWRVLAGEISENALHCATVPDGEIVDHVPTWEGGSFERIEAENRRALKKAEEAEIEANGYFTDPDWGEVVSADGVKGFVTSFVAPARRARALPHPLTADLSIPEFLSRT